MFSKHAEAADHGVPRSIAFATGMQVTVRTSGPVRPGKSIIPATRVVLPGTAIAQVAASVPVTAILAPMLASWMLKREGGLLSEEEIAKLEAMDLRCSDPQL
jgi:hypothetical protein